MSDAFKYIRFEIDESVGIITLNRPEKLNAINWELAEEMAGLLRDLRTRDEIRCLVLTGAGRSFCAGGDVDWISGKDDRPMPGTSDASRPIPRHQRKTPGGPFFDVTRQLILVDKPVIVALQGHAVGAGLAWALACDRRFADPTTKMAAIFANIGISPDCGLSYFLPRLVGRSNALMLVETAKMVKAEEAKQLGLIDELVAEGQALAAALDYAKLIAQKASAAVDMARRLIHLSDNFTLEEMLDYEGLAGVVIASTLDAKEGTLAFLEKRQAVFKGI